MLRKHLVIVGGGWAGLTLVRNLKNVNSKHLRITIISNEPNFRYSPGLYRVATGYREKEAIIPIGDVLSDIDHVDFVLDTATKINRKNRTLKTASGKTFHYDFAVIALGVVSSYFGIPGIEENSFTIKSTEGVKKFRTHLHEEIIADKAVDKNYVVVGAGATGVELSAALVSYLTRTAKWHGLRRSHITIDLIDAAPRVLPNMSEAASKKIHARLKKLGVHVMVKAKVEAETDSTLSVSGKSIPTHTVVWTGGVTNNPFFKLNENQFRLNEHGKVAVDDHLAVDDHTYVIGDNAATEFSGLALTAVHNAQFVAKDIKKRLAGKGQLSSYKPLHPAVVVPVGPNWAALQYRSILITGRLGALMRIAADFVGYMDVLGFWKALEIWTSTDQQEEQCAVCRVQLAHLNGSAELLEAN